VQREAQLLIALATERFMQAFALAMLAPAERERRTTISAKDVGASRFPSLPRKNPFMLLQVSSDEARIGSCFFRVSHISLTWRPTFDCARPRNAARVAR
jgi:hypothetical protein